MPDKNAPVRTRFSTVVGPQAGVQKPKPSNFFLNFDTLPPVSNRRWAPPVQAGCALGSMSRWRVSPF